MQETYVFDGGPKARRHSSAFKRGEFDEPVNYPVKDELADVVTTGSHFIDSFCRVIDVSLKRGLDRC